MNNIPFVKLFKTPMGYFFYDVNKNDIIKINECLYEYLEKIVAELPVLDNSTIDQTIGQLKQLGYLSPIHPSKIYNRSCEYIEDYINNCQENVLLQITQDCNFRCRYCAFSGDGILEREHQHKSMNLDIAKHAVDFVLKRSKYSEHINIGFYGGEPLIKFDLIKEIVEYVRESAPNKDFLFGMTTNGYLLRDQILEYLIENEFELLLSLDGPEPIHNKNRKLASNGKGTYNVVYDNLKNIYYNHPKYIGKIQINAVMDPETSYYETYDFFQNDEVLKNFNVTLSNLDDSRLDMSYYYNDDNIEVIESKKLRQVLKNSGILADKNNVRSYVDKGAEEFDKTLHDKAPISNIYHHNGPCMAGYMKLFIDINGNLWPCEKACDHSESMKIGNIFDGYDMDKINKMMNIGQLTAEECKNCWAMRFCGICAVYADNFECYSKEMKLRYCKQIKDDTLESLKKYATMESIKKELCNG